MKEWMKKLGSRKFLTAVAGFVAGLAMVFGLDEDAVSTIAGAVMSLCSVVGYLTAEGTLDAQRMEKER